MRRVLERCPSFLAKDLRALRVPACMHLAQSVHGFFQCSLLQKKVRVGEEDLGPAATCRAGSYSGDEEKEMERCPGEGGASSSSGAASSTPSPGEDQGCRGGESTDTEGKGGSIIDRALGS